MDESQAVLNHLERKMKPVNEQTLEDLILGKIGEFVMTTNEENLLLMEHWIKKARDQRQGKRNGTAWHR